VPARSPPARARARIKRGAREVKRAARAAKAPLKKAAAAPKTMAGRAISQEAAAPTAIGSQLRTLSRKPPALVIKSRSLWKRNLPASQRICAPTRMRPTPVAERPRSATMARTLEVKAGAIFMAKVLIEAPILALRAVKASCLKTFLAVQFKRLPHLRSTKRKLAWPQLASALKKAREKSATWRRGAEYHLPLKASL